ncbi:RNA ligase/cyclic nucleotide phosphodiesterase [Microdochium trichocladiopsis]|uniref:RNA ligase/cyclic nucleotide phosphodiesterase n=1 Tax=Microdochium trichocladiopsis TaxID=1682393 RepID=A0A9P8XU79_9PEZI|nr:RNA ligase/cyclic nucleotide phosphodiesterase [Microdochium trichocladiopsis]KAH7014419.1 RNA ligase/cyclic nucleotide phosphodiesterase [Microdochium trichocladiopsis]
MGSVAENPERPAYPTGVPIKFTPEGEAVRYPGNTTVCHIAPDSPLQPALQLVHDTIATHPTLFRIFRLLPPESWHMTVFDGVREIECEPNMWPVGKGKLPVDECTAIFAPKLRALGTQLEREGLAPPYRMRARGFLDVEAVSGLGFAIYGATEEEEKRVRRLRNMLADTLGFRAPNHYIYPFHVSVAYMLRWAEGDDRQEMFRVLDDLAVRTEVEFELGAVEFNTFETMLAYPRLFFLGEAE